MSHRSQKMLDLVRLVSTCFEIFNKIYLFVSKNEAKLKDDRLILKDDFSDYILNIVENEFYVAEYRTE